MAKDRFRALWVEYSLAARLMRSTGQPLAATPRKRLLADTIPNSADTISASSPEDVHSLLGIMLALLGPDQRANEQQVAQAVLDLGSAAVWEQLPEAADYHGVTLLIEPVVAALDRIATNAAITRARRVFTALASRHRELSTAREDCVERLIAAFNAAGVRVILLKGAALAHLIYPAPDLRSMLDIDILIDPADAPAAMKIAGHLNYVFASQPPTRFGGRRHHMPVAELTHCGFRIPLEIHTDAMSPDQPFRLTVSDLAAPPQPFARAIGHGGLALAHNDMLRHLARHTFEPADRIRLIHLYDLWRYQAIFHDQIDWLQIKARFPYVLVALELVSQVFAVAPGATAGRVKAVCKAQPNGVGRGMQPLFEIAASGVGAAAKLTALFNPPAWWLHGYYGVPLEQSLLVCQTMRHPAMLARWLARRAAAGAGLSHNGYRKFRPGIEPDVIV